MLSSGVMPLVEMHSRLFGRALISVPYLNGGGPLCRREDVEAGLLDEARQIAARAGARYCEFRCRQPLLESGAGKTWHRRDHKVAALLALPGDEEELWQRFPGKLRSQIRRPMKEGMTVRTVDGASFTAADLDGFYAVFARNMRDLGTPVYPRDLFRNVLESFGGDACIVLVSLADRVLAAGLLVGDGRSIEISLGFIIA